ncbi:MAG TPA: hypothetical protein VNA11_19640 [Pseudonocardia sp.]|nr:hypothetical protein [Pseudonocardia sp.]
MPVGRHRHAINVRADGLASVLGPLLKDPSVQAALLFDVDSGMVLDACGLTVDSEQEQLGADHADMLRLALGRALGIGPETQPPAGDCEIVVLLDGARHLVLRRVPDPFGDRLGLSVLVTGPPRAVRRARRRLRVVSAAALTAGPSVVLRPVGGSWVTGVTADRPAPPVRPRPLPTGSVPAPSGPSAEPVGGSALAALDAPRTPNPRTWPADVLPGGMRSVPAAMGPLSAVPPSAPRPAPPSALPPPAQRVQGD